MNRFSILIAACALLAALAGCGANNAYVGDRITAQPITSRLTEARATEIAENALRALSDGNRRAYIRDMYDSMRDVLSEQGFKALRDNRLARSGRFVSVADAMLIGTRTPGYVKWVCTCTFEKERVQVELIFKQDSDKILSANLTSIQ